MKHIIRVTNQAPARASFFQEVLCAVVTGVNALVGALGGEASVLGFVADKCTIEKPASTGDTANTTTGA